MSQTRRGGPAELDPTLDPAWRQASHFEPQAPLWLWPGRIPRGYLTLLVGDPGLGKSLLTLDLAARCTARRPWPDACPPHREYPRHTGGVVLAAAEDNPHHNAARLAAAGADLGWVFILEGVRRHGADDDPDPVKLPLHAPLLAQTIRAVTWPTLVIIDTLSAYVAAPTGAGGGAEGAIRALGELASRYDVAIVAVGHLSKTRTHRLLYRARGTLAYVAAARSVLWLAADPTDPSRRTLITLKSVHGPPAPPLSFRIADGPRLEWLAPPPDQMITDELPTDEGGMPSLYSAWACKERGTPSPHSSPACKPPCPSVAYTTADLYDLPLEATSALADACEWLRAALAAGPRPATDVIASASADGIAARTLFRAKRLIGAGSIKPADDVPWSWTLTPSSDNQHCQVAGAHT